MKKFLMSVGLVAFLGLTVTSCLKNDVPDQKPAQDPSVEKPAIDAFVDSIGYPMMNVSDSLPYFDVNQSTGVVTSRKFFPKVLRYQIVDPGEMNQGTTEVPDKDLGGSKTGNTTVYNKYTDSTLLFSVTYKGTYLDGEVFDSTKAGAAFLNVLPNMIAAWQIMVGQVGRGGHIRFVTPSAYAYGPNGSGPIPGNTPLYFDVYVKGFISNKYSSQ